jgi:hypothetical protein
MADQRNFQSESPIRWERDVRAADWLSTRLRPLGGWSRDLVPEGYEARARLVHPSAVGRDVLAGLTVAQRRAVVDVLRGETGTPSSCWFCVDDRRLEIDVQGVRERVSLPHGGSRYLLHHGPIDHALLPPPQKPLPRFEKDGGTVREFVEELREKLAGYTDLLMGFSEDSTPAEVKEALASLLDEVAPSLWWPEDRAWLVWTSDALMRGETWVAGSRRLVDRLLACPELEAVEETAKDSPADLERRRQERTYGPVLASGTELGRAWTFRGRIGEDGVWTSVNGSGGGGGPLPFQDLGWKKVAHFGALGWSSGPSLPPAPNHIEGVVSKQAAAVEVHLANGTVVPAQLIDTGDARAAFFIAFWPAADWEKLVARDARGEELETFLPSSV